MKRVLRRLLKMVLVLVIIVVLMASIFMYKVLYGLPFYEKNPINMELPEGEMNVLVYSKTNGFNHKKGIGGALDAISQMAKAGKWSVIYTKSGGVFNKDQLALFDVVVWNNVTGRTLTQEQRVAFKEYILTGGGFVGLHGAGDFSHHWDWYEHTLIRASFSHHTLHPQIQAGSILRECTTPDSTCADLPEVVRLDEEWYVFYDNPRQNQSDILYTLDASDINPNGNLLFLATDKNWGMGDDHPIIWKHCVEKGRAFYSALGHNDTNYRNTEYLRILEYGIEWAAGRNGTCIE